MKQGENASHPWSDDELQGFAYGDERWDAIFIAGLYHSGRIKEASAYLASKDDWPRLLPLVCDELNGKGKSELTQQRVGIVRAYICVRPAGAVAPTLFQVKLEYVRLFVRQERQPEDKHPRQWLRELQKRNKIPSERTFRETLRQCDFSLRDDQWSAATRERK
jgi:hypothetical protein